MYPTFLAKCQHERGIVGQEEVVSPRYEGYGNGLVMLGEWRERTPLGKMVMNPQG